MTSQPFRPKRSPRAQPSPLETGGSFSKIGFAILLVFIGVAHAISLAHPAMAQSTISPSAPPRVFTCEHANSPTEAYIGWSAKESGAFLFTCLVFADRSGVAFQMTYRSPPPPGKPSASIIGGGWGTDFDDFAYALKGGRIAIRNGVDGSVDTYAEPRKGAPLLVVGHSEEQRERRAQGCEYVEPEKDGGVRRIFCNRTIQHFDGEGRLSSYSTHAFRQIFALSRWEGVGVTVTGEKPLLSVTGQAPDGRNIFAAFRSRPESLAVKDQDDRSVVFQFDPVGRLTQVRSSAGETYRFRYGPRGELLAVTFPDGRDQTMTYDRKRRISTIEARDGASARFIYKRNETEVLEQLPDGSRGRTVFKFR